MQKKLIKMVPIAVTQFRRVTRVSEYLPEICSPSTLLMRWNQLSDPQQTNKLNSTEFVELLSTLYNKY